MGNNGIFSKTKESSETTIKEKEKDFEYVQETSQLANLTFITNDNPSIIYTKLKAYPYEFGIDGTF